MFPDFAELDRSADESEFLLTHMYDEALSRWIPAVEASVLPTMADGSVYPPNPDGFTTQTAVSAWDTLSEMWVASGLMILWCYHHLRAVDALSAPVTASGARKPRPVLSPPGTVKKAGSTQTGTTVEPGVPLDLPDPVANAFALAWKQNPDVVRRLVQQVSDMPWSKQQMMNYLGATKSIRGSVPGQIRDLVLGEISATRRKAIPVDSVRRWLKAYTDPAAALYGDGAATDVPRVPINQASGVINDALVAAMQSSPEPWDKVWVAHMDDRTRPAHFIADGQRAPKDGKFVVGGVEMKYPGDPDAPPALTVACRCRVGAVRPGEGMPPDTHRSRAHQREIRERTAAGQIRAREDPNGIGYQAPSQITAAIYAAISDPKEETPVGTYLTFTDALFAVTGTPTDDHRMLSADIDLRMRDFPLPLMWQEKTSEGHAGAVGVGVIESMTYEDGEVRGSGYLLNSDNAVKAMELIAHQVANPSVDLADATGMLTYEDGTPVTDDNFDETQPMYETFTAATLTAATIVSIPAFGETRLTLNPDREERSTGLEDALVAAVERPVYDPALFADADPNLLSTYRLTMDPDTGRVHGFMARWTDRHRSVGMGHIRPPRSHTGYEHFHTSPAVQLADGTMLPVGRLTVGIGHAPTRGVSAAAAQAHYDNVDSCWAIGRVSEHRLGLFFSGVAAPWASPEKVQMGLASPVSGDWRPIGPGRALELVAILSVNTPGFLCTVETDADGAPLAMVASLGQVDDQPRWSLDVVKAALGQVLDERDARAVEVETGRVLAERLGQVFTRTVETVGEPLSPTGRMAELLSARGA